MTGTIVVAKMALVEQSKQDNQFATKSDLREFGDELKVHVQELGNKLETHMGVLFEKASEQTALLAEQFGDFRKAQNNHDKKIDTLTERVDTLTDVVGEIKIDLSDVKIVVNEVKDGLDNKVDKKDFIKLEKQVTGLASRVG